MNDSDNDGITIMQVMLRLVRPTTPTPEEALEFWQQMSQAHKEAATRLYFMLMYSAERVVELLDAYKAELKRLNDRHHVN